MIVEMVNTQKKVSVLQLCEKFDVSQATVRNDLRKLESIGLIIRIHGGAICSEHTYHGPCVYDKETECIKKKREIAKVAINCIGRGETIALDTGATMYELAKNLGDINDLTIITYDVHIASHLDRYTNANIVFIGGQVRKEFHCTVGDRAISTLNSLNVDKSFITAHSVSLSNGLTTTNIEMARVKRKIIEIADQVYLLADSQRFGKASAIRFSSIENVDVIITDAGIPPQMLTSLKNNNISVLVTGSKY